MKIAHWIYYRLKEMEKLEGRETWRRFAFRLQIFAIKLSQTRPELFE